MKAIFSEVGKSLWVRTSAVDQAVQMLQHIHKTGISSDLKYFFSTNNCELEINLEYLDFVTQIPLHIISQIQNNQ